MASLLTACPVIIPPRPGLIDSWNHPHHMVIVNGYRDDWHNLARSHAWQIHESPDGGNLGCPTSWNVAFLAAEALGHTHVAILSQSLVLNHGGTAVLADLVDHYADNRGLATPHSFHCAVFSVRLWRKLGGFDVRLPIFADVDFLRRGWLAGELHPDRPIPLAHVTGRDEGNAAVKAGAVWEELYSLDEIRYIEKWGGPPGAERAQATPMRNGRFTL